MGNEDEPTRSQTEDSAERGHSDEEADTRAPLTYRDLGQAEELGQEDSGDIADEGRGHRG
jgi:hypothetical protein